MNFVNGSVVVQNIHEHFVNTFNQCSWLFINYLVHQISEFMAVHEQPKLINKVKVYEQDKLVNSCLVMKVSFVLQEFSGTVHKHYVERSCTFVVFCSRIFINYSCIFMNSSSSSHRGCVTRIRNNNRLDT